MCSSKNIFIPQNPFINHWLLKQVIIVYLKSEGTRSCQLISLENSNWVSDLRDQKWPRNTFLRETQIPRKNEWMNEKWFIHDHCMKLKCYNWISFLLGFIFKLDRIFGVAFSFRILFVQFIYKYIQASCTKILDLWVMHRKNTYW